MPRTFCFCHSMNLLNHWTTHRHVPCVGLAMMVVSMHEKQNLRTWNEIEVFGLDHRWQKHLRSLNDIFVLCLLGFSFEKPLLILFQRFDLNRHRLDSLLLLCRGPPPMTRNWMREVFRRFSLGLLVCSTPISTFTCIFGYTNLASQSSLLFNNTLGSFSKGKGMLFEFRNSHVLLIGGCGLLEN